MEHKFLPITFLKSLELLITAILSLLFRLPGLSIEMSQKTTETVIKNTSKLFVFGKVAFTDVVSIRPYYIGTSKNTYLRSLGHSFRSMLVGFCIFATLTAVISCYLPKKVNLQLVQEENIPKGMECIMCLSQGRKVLFWPCNHLCSCETCLTKLTKCPICRMEIEYYYKINY